MPRIRLHTSGRAIEYVPGMTLMDLLAEAGVMPRSPCGASGTCGKCTVTVLGDRLPEPRRQERDMYAPQRLAEGIRLACLLVPDTDLDVIVPGDNAVSKE